MEKINKKELIKGLESVIEETLSELEELKKSKFSAAEIKIEGPGDGIDGKPVNGKLDAKKAEDEDEEEDDKEKKEEKEEECEKGVNEEKGSGEGAAAKLSNIAKMEDGIYKKEGECFTKMEEPTEKSEPENKEGEDLEKNDTDEDEALAKAQADHEKEKEELTKSFNEKIGTFEETLAKMAETIQQLSDQPLERKGVSANATPLKKSEDVPEPLNKTEVASKLFDLKKSGQEVSTEDIARVELGSDETAREVATKYNLK